MSSLVEQLGKPPKRATVVADCVELIDAQVKQKGFVIKSAYATIKAIKKRFVPEVVDGLLDDWLQKLQPHHDKWSAAKQGSFSDYVISRSDDVAEDLLSVTDARAQRTSHTTAKKNVVEAIPELSRMIERHLAAAPPQPTASV